jgi:hypothetical protein
MVSRRADRSDLCRLGFEHLVNRQLELAEAQAPWQATAFRAERHRYLAYHRSQVFIC